MVYPMAGQQTEKLRGGALRRVWDWYAQGIRNKCQHEMDEADGLPYWRKELFISILTYTFPFSFIALVPGVVLSFMNGLYVLAFTDILAVCILVFITWVPGMSLRTRKILFVADIFLLSNVLLSILGLFGPGLEYMLLSSIISILIFERKYAKIIPLLITVCGIGYYIGLEWGWIHWSYADPSPEGFVGIYSNLIFLTFVAGAIVPVIFNGLQITLSKEKRLSQELKIKSGQLQEKMQQLQENNQVLRDFARAATHDLKEPLRAVATFVELLKAKYGDQLDEKGKQYIQFAIQGAKNMSGLIDDLLNFTYHSEELNQMEDCHIEEILQSVKSLYQGNMIPQDQVIWHSIPIIKGRPKSLRILFQNIIGNALKFRKMDVPAVIEITSEQKEPFIEFCISDNGIGFSMEHAEKIFEIFKRLHTKSAYSGNGIGLAMSRRIVEEHGGRIWAESVPGIGSKFYFTLLNPTHETQSTIG